MELLVKDVVRAGAGLSNPLAVELLAKYGPPLLDEMLNGPDGATFEVAKYCLADRDLISLITSPSFILSGGNRTK